MSRTTTCILLVLVTLLTLGGCQQSEKYPPEVRWVKNSAEYAVICQMVYRATWDAVKSETAGLQEDWVVVLDVDETVLDNSRYQEILYEQGKTFPYYWDDWVKEEDCPAVPGANAFIDSVRSLGQYAHVAYITNRNAPLTEATRSNLRAAGLWQDGDILLCQQDRQDSKFKRRQEVMQGKGRCDGLGVKKIVALVGDQLRDMADYPAGMTVAEYRTSYAQQPAWGQRFFILPNPMYGYWYRQYPR